MIPPILWHLLTFRKIVKIFQPLEKLCKIFSQIFHLEETKWNSHLLNNFGVKLIHKFITRTVQYLKLAKLLPKIVINIWLKEEELSCFLICNSSKLQLLLQQLVVEFASVFSNFNGIFETIVIRNNLPSFICSNYSNLGEWSKFLKDCIRS